MKRERRRNREAEKGLKTENEKGREATRSDFKVSNASSMPRLKAAAFGPVAE